MSVVPHFSCGCVVSFAFMFSVKELVWDISATVLKRQELKPSLNIRACNSNNPNENHERDYEHNMSTLLKLQNSVVNSDWKLNAQIKTLFELWGVCNVFPHGACMSVCHHQCLPSGWASCGCSIHYPDHSTWIRLKNTADTKSQTRGSRKR